jgi:hypothetical protein
MLSLASSSIGAVSIFSEPPVHTLIRLLAGSCPYSCRFSHFAYSQASRKFKIHPQPSGPRTNSTYMKSVFYLLAPRCDVVMVNGLGGGYLILKPVNQCSSYRQLEKSMGSPQSMLCLEIWQGCHFLHSSSTGYRKRPS